MFKKLFLVLCLAIGGLTVGSAPASAVADPPAQCKLPNRNFLSLGIPSNWNNFPQPVGQIRAALLFRGYSNAGARDQYNQFRAAEGWFNTSSFGRYTLTLVPHFPAAALSDTAAQRAARLGAGDGLTGDVVIPGTGTQAATAWGTAAQSVDNVFDFSNIDVVFFADAATSRSYAEFESNFYLDGHRIKAGATLGSDWAGYRHLLLGHEHGHTISLPDEYGGGGSGFEYTGGWGIMGNLGGPSPDVFAWEKWKLGWLDDNQMSCVRTLNTSTEETVTPLETQGGTKAIVVRYSDTIAYVAEVRTNKGVNTRTCSTGVLVYRVDSAIQSAAGPVRVMDSRPGSGGCGSIRHELNDGVYGVGQSFVDNNARVRIQVMAKSGDNYVVRATYGTPAGNDFSMAVNPASGSVAPGGSTSSTVQTQVTSGAAQQITLSASGLPGGVSATFTPSTVTAGQSATMTLASSASTAGGSYPIAVKGQAASGSHAATYTLTVQSNQVTVFSDDFEIDRGWVVNATGSDTATAGRFERNDPEATVYNGTTYQLGSTTSGTRDLVTGALAGPDAGTHDVDGGLTSVRSPAITLPNAGPITLSFQQYFAHLDNASAADYMRVKVNGSTVFERLGSASIRGGVWSAASADLTALAGQSIRITVEVADNDTGSMIEGGVDDVRITAPQQSATVFSDEFDTDKGWTVNAAGSDTATTGIWARGVPGETSYQGTVCQRSNGTSALATGLAGGVDCAQNDVDGGVTSIRSPLIALPSGGSYTLSVHYYLAHLNNATTADYLRIKVGATVVFQRLAGPSNVSAAWQTATVDLSSFAGQTIQLTIEAADNDTGSLIEAAIDDVIVKKG